MGVGAAEKIANFIVETDYDHIPKEAIGVAKNAVLDWLGVTVTGSAEPAAKIMAEYVRQIGAAGEAGMICGGLRTSADLAACVNGIASHVLDYDDTFPDSVNYNMHPSVSILPAVLALGEKRKVSGREILVAYVVGIEVESRIGSTIGRYNSEAGWHPTPILGTIGAVAASAKILKLNVLQTRMALGIASSSASGLRHNFGTMTKSLHAGNAARNGVVAALLAEHGFTANDNILEGQFGFYNIFSGGRVSELINNTQGLGNSWCIVSPGISFKPYPCCRSTHSGIDATLHLRKKYKISANEVAAVTCKTSPMTAKIAMHHQPRTGLEGKFSLEYCVATALLRGKVSLEDFTDERVTEAKAQDLLSKVSYLHPKEYSTSGGSLAQEVVIELKNGTEYSHRVTFPKGDPKNPMTNKELLAKFRDCATLSLTQLETEQVLDLITELEYLDDISRLMEILT